MLFYKKLLNILHIFLHFFAIVNSLQFQMNSITWWRITWLMVITWSIIFLSAMINDRLYLAVILPQLRKLEVFEHPLPMVQSL